MKGEDDMAGTREYEDLNKNLEMVDEIGRAHV